jgi:type II secretory pathway pseudopilin PulG
MNIAPREKRTLLIGLVVVLLVGILMGVSRLKAMTRSGSSEADKKRTAFADARARIAAYQTVGVDLKKLTDNLHVEIPTDSSADQRKRLTEVFDSVANRSSVQIRTFTLLKVQQTKGASRTAARGVTPVEIKLDVNCRGFAGLVRFIDGLERATVPIVVDQVSITTTGGRGGSSGSRGSRGGSSMPGGMGPGGTMMSPGGTMMGPGGPMTMGPGGSGASSRRELQASLKIFTYIFPEKVQQ